MDRSLRYKYFCGFKAFLQAWGYPSSSQALLFRVGLKSAVRFVVPPKWRLQSSGRFFLPLSKRVSWMLVLRRE